ncbi:hypothetical protein PIGHUM_03490 [Pigmentiphaga humi]|uniref:Uncharacterized protein n=1 Tax=Pigmentiphaga humi TaxID=2478468 RepID=A0A3P4B7B2_9BURK|nr:hypothetical protein [Pigmentiphaga humi]VCU71406.1 hypothetical protein PIGHUM_03490 [Pigmentiphaga humi]
MMRPASLVPAAAGGRRLASTRRRAKLRRRVRRLGVRVLSRLTRRVRSELKQLERESYLAPF